MTFPFPTFMPRVGALPPTVTSISPTAGPAAGFQPVTITGTHLLGATQVFFGAVPAASFAVVNDTTIQAYTPAAPSTMEGYITVITPGGATEPTVLWIWYAAPVITNINPTSGPTTGGTVVTISGVNFATATAVSFGSIPAASFTVNSDQQITAVAPPGVASQPGYIFVTAIGGANQSSQVWSWVAPVFATWDPNAKNGMVNLTNNNLNASVATRTTNSAVRTNIPMFMGAGGGKWYWEVQVFAMLDGELPGVGVCDPNFPVTSNAACLGGNDSYAIQSDGTIWRGGGAAWNTSQGVVNANDILMFAFDAANGWMWVGKNGAWANGSVPDIGGWRIPIGSNVTINRYWPAVSSGQYQASTRFGVGAWFGPNFNYSVPAGYRGLSS